ncbi:peptidase M38 [Ensifer sp. Root31]|uniref:metal-dependent hydrolase family protein n=1 Tax=Ensifer sp. Root31 TaxID=1736512 RepID=UPI000710428F|nr:amidohydrolase family protein [Ensifer sp. Root31]KQU86441.1 peptidase M38 [Ensifer sp. Root31]
MTSHLIINAPIVDGAHSERSAPMQVLVENGIIIDVDKSISSSKAEVIDAGGRTLMPGLIDCHVHVIACLADLGRNAMLPDSLVTARASRIMRGMLMRGFTTVRDVGGADFGLKIAMDEGLIEGPRLVISGKALSQTGGHCDFRGRFDDSPARSNGHRLGSLGRLCDGDAEVRRAVREEIKAGADFIKVMANGGCASPTDPIHFLGFSKSELMAIVEEAANAGTYVAAHVYTDAAIRRAVDCGIRSLEHCNLIGEETALRAVEAGCIAVPTLVTYDKLSSEGLQLGFPADSVAKVENVRIAGMESLEIMRRVGLPMAYGSDLLGDMHKHQSDEFVIRGQVLPAQDVIASATSVGARLLGAESRIGSVSPGFEADLILVDGNPLDDLRLLSGQGQHMPLIMQQGRIVKHCALN